MAVTFNERSGFKPWGGFETNDSICALPGGFADDQQTPAVLKKSAPASLRSTPK
jgi:hypothetical protein